MAFNLGWVTLAKCFLSQSLSFVIRNGDNDIPISEGSDDRVRETHKAYTSHLPGVLAAGFQLCPSPLAPHVYWPFLSGLAQEASPEFNTVSLLGT